MRVPESIHHLDGSVGAGGVALPAQYLALAGHAQLGGEVVFSLGGSRVHVLLHLAITAIRCSPIRKRTFISCESIVIDNGSYDHSYMLTNARAHARTSTHARTHKHAHARTHKHAHARTHKHAHAHTRTHKHTHACTTCVEGHVVWLCWCHLQLGARVASRSGGQPKVKSHVSLF